MARSCIFSVNYDCIFVVCVPLQSYFGLYGVAVTEIILLILALLFAKVMGIPCALCFGAFAGRTADVRNYSDVDFVLYPCNGRFADPVSAFPGEMATINED